MEMLIDFIKKILGLDKLDYRIRRLERVKYWKECIYGSIKIYPKWRRKN